MIGHRSGNPVIVIDGVGHVAAVLESYQSLWRVRPLPSDYCVLGPDKESQREQYLQALLEVRRAPEKWGRWYS